ncbi:TrkH family potassium uptake protein [soil metagenome]
MRVGHLVHTVGIVLLAFSLALLATTLVAWGYGEGDTLAFLLTTLATAAAGFLAVRFTTLEGSLSIREGYAVVSLTWIVVGVIGGIPYLLSGVIADPVAAVFESVSGFTTTGATVFSEIESLPHGILFWRSLTQWLGGMGIILLGIAILPFLGVGGMYLFRAEVPGPTPERLTPRIAQTAKLLWYVYASLTAALIVLLLVGGMGVFDAVNHALTTMPTGGFSTRNASVAAYESPFIQYMIILFMYLAGVNFVLHFRAMTGKQGAYGKSSEWRFFTWVLGVGTLVVLLAILLGGAYEGLGLERAFRDALFQVVSLATTTGFATANYNLWPLGAQLVLVGLMFMGGMAGSTGGGIKAMRIYVLLRQGVAELQRSIHPRAVVVTRLGNKPLEDPVLLNILGFVLLFLGIFAAGVVCLAFLGHDLPTAIGASVATIANIGPGIGDVGAVDNYGWMDPWSHLLLIALMIIGRLEIFTVLLLFHPGLWRR